MDRTVVVSVPVLQTVKPSTTILDADGVDRYKFEKSLGAVPTCSPAVAALTQFVLAGTDLRSQSAMMLSEAGVSEFITEVDVNDGAAGLASLPFDLSPHSEAASQGASRRLCRSESGWAIQAHVSCFAAGKAILRQLQDDLHASSGAAPTARTELACLTNENLQQLALALASPDPMQGGVAGNVLRRAILGLQSVTEKLTAFVDVDTALIHAAVNGLRILSTEVCGDEDVDPSFSKFFDKLAGVDLRASFQKLVGILLAQSSHAALQLYFRGLPPADCAVVEAVISSILLRSIRVAQVCGAGVFKMRGALRCGIRSCSVDLGEIHDCQRPHTAKQLAAAGDSTCGSSRPSIVSRPCGCPGRWIGIPCRFRFVQSRTD